MQDEDRRADGEILAPLRSFSSHSRKYFRFRLWGDILAIQLLKGVDSLGTAHEHQIRLVYQPIVLQKDLLLPIRTESQRKAL